MADVKVSSLSSATTPLTGTEEVYIIQGGTSYKTTAQDVANLAGGSGIWGISDSSGAYTFYATIALANAAATSGDVIELFADVEETGAVEWILKDGVNYNLNGHTYTLNVASTEDAVTDNNVAVTCTIFNGTIKRTGGASSNSNSLSIFIDNANTVLNLQGVNVLSDFGYASRIDGLIDGGNFQGVVCGVYLIGNARNIVSKGTSGYGIFMQTNSDCDNCKGYGTTNQGIYGGNSSVISNSYGYSSSSRGIYGGISTKIVNSVGYSDGSYGIQNQNSTEIINSVGYSTSSYGILGGTVGLVINSTGYSSASDGIRTSGIELRNSVGYSTTTFGIYSDSATQYTYGCHAVSKASSGMYSRGEVYNSTIISEWDNASGHALTSTSGCYTKVFNCYLDVKNASAYCLNYGSAVNVYYGNNTFGQNATTPVNANITQAQTNTPDTYGNIQIG